MKKLLERSFAKGGLAIDERFDPIVITTWYGEADRTMVDAYFEWYDGYIDGAVARGKPMVLVSDVLDAVRVDAVIRKYIADQSEQRRTDAREALLAGNFVAVRSAAVRGALTAISWLSTKPNTMKPVKDIETALEKAAEVLRNRGVEVPSGLDRYARPPTIVGRAS